MSIQHLVNQYQPRSETIDLSDDVRAAYIEASHQETTSKLKQLGALLRGVISIKPLASGVDSAVPFDFDIDVSSILTNMNSSEMKDLEKFILSKCFISIKHEGEWLNVEMDKKDQVEYVFKAHPDVFLKFLLEGAKFHFLKYSGNILDLLNSKIQEQTNQEANKALLKSLTTG